MSNEIEDLLCGVQAIADYAKLDYRKTHYLLSKGHLPGWKIGHRWYSNKTKIRKRLLGEEEAA
jgi:hypothetical protein